MWLAESAAFHKDHNSLVSLSVAVEVGLKLKFYIYFNLLSSSIVAIWFLFELMLLCNIESRGSLKNNPISLSSRIKHNSLSSIFNYFRFHGLPRRSNKVRHIFTFTCCQYLCHFPAFKSYFKPYVYVYKYFLLERDNN